MTTPLIEWGAAGRAQPGQAVSGDRYVVAPFPQGAAVGVVDGLGHGALAAAAAQVAVDMIQKHASEPVIEIIHRCHDALISTRGVVLTLASFSASANTMTWAGVGNVEGVLLRGGESKREAAFLRGGVVGYQLPTLRAPTIGIAPGDTVILATDGIRSAFLDNLTFTLPPQSIADDILARFGRETDDALVLVARYLGDAP